ncbi:hypothetical protein GQ55_1G045400 [Panicum hallii var. hallii]|uniref:Uncharacterized protein n=1 Tax=Panicum hallii var. hallii TaxID=1504633 RepID=A0A2T7F2A1_9POAL|nr:hypothetical protein GQ55_1G045400 [Panicum hallii var. hallii]
MAKAQTAARFVTEVAPPPAVTVVRRRKVPRSLDTIAEDDREQLEYGPASDHQGFVAAWSRRAAPAPARERAGRLMRELSKSAGTSRTPTASRPAPAAGRVATS